MRLSVFLIFPSIFLLCSCSDSRTEFASKWTRDIKAKILEDSGKQPDSTQVENRREDFKIVTIFKNAVRLKQFGINPITNDTLWITSSSKDQAFALERELCPLLKDEYVEVILYKKVTLGQHTFYYCNGKIKKQGFNIHGYVGTWKEYDNEGNLTNKIDYGNEDKLDTLKAIRYYR
jgi:hypothetical protein